MLKTKPHELWFQFLELLSIKKKKKKKANTDVSKFLEHIHAQTKLELLVPLQNFLF